MDSSGSPGGGKADEIAEEDCPGPVVGFVEDCIAEVQDEMGMDRLSAIEGCFGTPFFGFGDEPDEVFADLCLTEGGSFCDLGNEHFVLEVVPQCEDAFVASAQDLSGDDCSLANDEPRSLVRFALNDHIQYRCRGEDSFVNTACCDDELEDFTATSQCPLQVTWSDASGSARRCMADTADTEGGQFAPTACCEALCPINVELRQQSNGTRCVANGQFVNDVCCEIKADAACEAAAFDTEVARSGTRLCRDQGTGQFAPSLCCIDDCFDEILSGRDIPPACLTSVEAECANAAPNSIGACHSTETGKFLKAACCDLDLAAEDRDRADFLFECEELNHQIIQCQTGDDFACDLQEATLTTDFDESCCDANPDSGWEFCF
jgi:hypothetical protein